MQLMWIAVVCSAWVALGILSTWFGTALNQQDRLLAPGL